MAFSHTVDEDSLQFSKMIYSNSSGNEFSVFRLHYFISGVSLYREGVREFRQATKPQAINARYADSRSILLQNVPAGSFDSLSFSLGVVPEWNYDNAFQLSTNDLHMYWPPELGGGYHFMKFEGHWQDSGQFGGFAFHIGQNENLVSSGFPLELKIKEKEMARLDVAMNVNKWFDEPFTYNLLHQGGYTMGDTVQMGWLVSNGHDVFSLKGN